MEEGHQGRGFIVRETAQRTPQIDRPSFTFTISADTIKFVPIESQDIHQTITEFYKSEHDENPTRDSGLTASLRHHKSSNAIVLPSIRIICSSSRIPITISRIGRRQLEVDNQLPTLTYVEYW
jgi:hypothetical protein